MSHQTTLAHSIGYLPKVIAPRSIVFSDLDETYLAHHMTDERRADLHALEDYLHRNCITQKLCFGWVTGSGLASVLDKINGYELRRLPHFIACALGSELYWLHDHDGFIPDQGWRMLMSGSNFNNLVITHLLAELAKAGISLSRQSDGQQGTFKASYYYIGENPEQAGRDTQLIRDAVKRADLGVNISQCNPNTGDPPNAYDIDVTPTVAGKSQVVHYLLDQLGLTAGEGVAFGDSGNDLSMLSAVKHGYLVANATDEAKANHNQRTQHPYTKGILETLQALA